MVTNIEIVVNPSIIVSCEIALVIVKDHSRLENLDYAHSGHTGFASSEALSQVDNSAVHKSGDERVGGIKTFTAAINFDSLMYTNYGEFRFNDHVYFTDNTNEHNKVLEIYANDILAKKTFTAKSNLNVDGLIYAGGNELRFNQHLNITDNTNEHNTILHVYKDWINAERIVTLKQGANCDTQPTEAQHVTRKDYVDNLHASSFRNNQIKSELIPDEFDEVMEFTKQVSGSSYLTDTLATENGSIVWCAATKAICGDAHYRKFLVNTNGTAAGITTISPVSGKLYVGKTDNNLFKWSGSNLLEVSKSLGLGETSTTAYAGNKGKANAQAIAELQSKQLNVVGFYDSYDGTYNNLTFPTSQTQMITCGYKYDSNSPIRGASVPLFNDNTMELAPNNNGDYLKITTTSNNDGTTTLTIDQSGMSYFRILVIETNINLILGA